MADGPVLIASLSSGDVYNDPSEDALFEFFLDIEKGAEEYFTVGRASDPTDQTYVQTILDDNGKWMVEYRDGGPDEHYIASFDDLRKAHAVLAAWCFVHDPDLLAGVPWERLTF